MIGIIDKIYHHKVLISQLAGSSCTEKKPIEKTLSRDFNGFSSL